MAPNYSTEQLEMDSGTSGKKSGLPWIKVKIMLVVFIILLILVGLLSGVLAAKSARQEAEEKYEREKLEGEDSSFSYQLAYDI